MQWLLVFALPAMAFGVVGILVPGSGSSRLSGLRRKLRERLTPRRRAAPPDPFDVLRLQTRLGRVADQVRTLECTCDGAVFAKAQRLHATRAAYDDLLAEACRLAGVEVDPGEPRSEDERLREEMELAARGWSW